MIATTWQEFSDAIAEAQARYAAGAGAEVLQRVLQRARQLLRALDDALAGNECLPADARNALEQLRAGLAELESAPITRH